MIAKRTIVIIASLGTYMLFFSCSSPKNPTSTGANPVPTSTISSTASASPNSTPSNTNSLSDEKVEAAVRKAFRKLQPDGRMASGVDVRIIGIQEPSGSSAAKADLELTNAMFLQDDMLNGRWEVGKGGYGGRMV